MNLKAPIALAVLLLAAAIPIVAQEESAESDDPALTTMARLLLSVKLVRALVVLSAELDISDGSSLRKNPSDDSRSRPPWVPSR